MRLSRGVRAFFAGMTGLVLVYLYLPLSMVVVLSFNTATSLSFPPKGVTLKWWNKAAQNTGARDALWTSVQVAIGATLVALVLGTLASLAIQRFRFFGRNTLSLLIVLPIALPGIVTGIALNAAFRQVGLPFGMLTLIIAHATFCIVVMYNNSLARLRRMSPNLEEASADLGADTFQTYRHVTFPLMRTALLAGGLLAFGLSFDEIVVTTFTSSAGLETLPLWILNNLSRGEQAPIVTVVASAVMLLSIIPVWLAQRLTSGDGPVTGGTVLTDAAFDLARLESAIDAARVVDDFVRGIVELAGGELGGGRDVSRNWTQRGLGGWIYGERHIARQMSGTHGREQLFKAAVAADDLIAEFERLSEVRTDPARTARTAVAGLGVADLPAALRDPGLDPASRDAAQVHLQLSRIIAVLHEARTKVLLAEMRSRPPGEQSGKPDV